MRTETKEMTEERQRIVTCALFVEKDADGGEVGLFGPVFLRPDGSTDLVVPKTDQERALVQQYLAIAAAAQFTLDNITQVGLAYASAAFLEAAFLRDVEAPVREKAAADEKETRFVLQKAFGDQKEKIMNDVRKQARLEGRLFQDNPERLARVDGNDKYVKCECSV